MKYYYHTLLKWLVMFAIVLFSSYAKTAIELKFITLKVAPWAYIDETSKSVRGVFPDLIQEIKNRTGYDIKITLAPYARIDRELESARQDCTMLIRNSKKESISIQGELIFNHHIGVVPKKPLLIDSYDDLYKMRISLLRGSYISDRFDNDNKLIKDFDTDYEISLSKIKYGRLDAIAGAIDTIQYLAKKNGAGDLLGKPLQLKLAPIYLQCSKKSKKLEYVNHINAAIKSMRSSGVIDAIVKQYN